MDFFACRNTKASQCSLGTGPRYFGSDENVTALIPAAQFAAGLYKALLLGNYLALDLTQSPEWSAGPVGILRFARSKSDNPQIDALPDINWTVDLGFELHRRWNHTDYQRMGAIGSTVLGDVGGVHNGWTVSASLSQFFPVGQYGVLGLAGGSHYGSENYTRTYFGITNEGSAMSGLSAFSPNAGMRDVYAAALFIQPVSKEWAVGAGALYSQLLNDAADSPITARNDNLYFGIGVMRFW